MLSDKDVKIKFDILSNKLKLNLFDEVISETIPLLKKRKHQVFFNILSVAYQSLGDYKKSLEVMKEALQLNPKNPYFLNNIATTVHKLEKFEEAEMYFKKGLEIAPNYINILNNLANLKKDLNYTEEAIEYYKKSLAVDDRNIEANLNIANSYQSLGKFSESINYLRKVLEINTKFTVADRIISSMKKYKNISDPHLNEMLNKIKKFDLNDEQLTNLHFGIGKAFEDIKDYKKSYDNYHNGNRLLKKNFKFDIAKEKKKFDQIKKFFSFYEGIKINRNQKKIIFIVGMPRSGTSLIEQILSSHSDIFGCGELTFLSNSINFNLIDNHHNLSLGQIANIKEIFEIIQNEYLNKIKLIDNIHNNLTDKAPLNFRYIGFIKNIFPNSVIIHCKRNAVETSWSNYKNYFPSSLPFTNDLKDIVEYYKIYENLMNFWNDLFKDSIYDIEYETLINDPANQIKKLINVCGLEWDESCLKHENNSRSIKTASATQARKPIYNTALKHSDNFIQYLSELTNNL